MRKLAYEYAGAGGFEMPALHRVDLEKENSIVLAATPKTVYKGNTSGFSRGIPVSYTHLDVYKRQVKMLRRQRRTRKRVL